jgi:hypothetical protein
MAMIMIVSLCNKTGGTEPILDSSLFSVEVLTFPKIHDATSMILCLFKFCGTI